MTHGIEITRDEMYLPGVYVTTLHEFFTPEYTLTAMLAGTYSVLVVLPIVLHGP